MPDIFPAETVVDLDWDTSGDPDMERALRGFAPWGWGTGGSPIREILVEPGAVGWSWNSGGSELERQELLVGTGVKLSVYELANPEERLAIVRYEKLDFEEGLSGIYGAQATVGIQWFDPAWLEQDMLWRIDVEGVERSAFITQDNRDFKVSKDGKRVEIAGRSTASVLEWATVAPAEFGGPNQSVTRRFTAPRAAVLYTLLLEAQARGAIPMVVADAWNATIGSDGVPWTDLPELEFNAGSTLFDRTMEWSDLGYEWHMDSRFRWRVGTHLGRDLSQQVRLFPAQGIEEQQITRSFKELRTALFVQDGNEGVSLIDDDAAIDEFGVREQYVVFSDTVSEGDRTANGYMLLNLLKNPVVERIVEIDPYAEGRRPFVDFGLGDEISVMFGGQPFPFRVLAISMSSEPGVRPRCEVVLEDMIEAARRRRQRLLDANGGGGGVSTGQQTIFAENSTAMTLGTASSDICQISLTSFISTYGKLGWMLNGIASGPLTLRVDLVYDSTIIRSFRHQVPRAGWDTAEITWLWTAIPQGTSGVMLRVTTDTGTFELPAAGDAQLWVEAKGIQGAITNSPDIVVNDNTPHGATADLDPVLITDTASTSDLTTDWPDIGDTVPIDVVTVTDTVGPSGAGEIILGVDQVTVLAAEDGWTSTGTAFSNTDVESIVGDVGGVKYGSFYRFDLPSGVDLTGVTITDAFITGRATITSAVVARTTLRLVDAADPATITSRADFLSRATVSNATDWETAMVAGNTYRSPQVMAQAVQQLVDSYGDLESLLILHTDNAGPPNGQMRFRSVESTSPNVPMVLTIRFIPA